MTRETLKVYRIKGTNQPPTHPFATLIISHGETTPGNQLTQEDSIENALHSLFPGNGSTSTTKHTKSTPEHQTQTTTNP